MHSRPRSIVIALIIFFSLAGPAAAHKVMVFAWVSGNTIHTESKFSGGRKVKAGKIEVFDPQGKLLLSGKTNEQGEFSFPIPQPSALKIVLDAGMGHRGEWTISRDEVVNAGPADPATPPADNTGDGKPVPAAAVQTAARAPATATGLSTEELQRVLEKALDRKLEPVYRMLAEAKEHKPTMTDVIGGIGSSSGLVGLAAYMQARRPRPS